MPPGCVLGGGMDCIADKTLLSAVFLAFMFPFQRFPPPLSLMSTVCCVPKRFTEKYIFKFLA